MLLTVTSTKSAEEQGKLVVFEREGLVKIHEIDITNSVIIFAVYLFCPKNI
jgi:hypothetical protein